MKGYYNELLDIQDFGINFEDTIKKRKDLFKDTVKVITPTIKTYLHRVEYEYKTKRGNKKSNYKIVALTNLDESEAKIQVLEQINKDNKEFPYREISNVKILDITYEEMIIPLI